MKLKRYNGPDIYDLDDELYEVIYQLWRVNPMLQRLLSKGFVDWHEIDYANEDNLKELAGNPNAAMRERYRASVSKHGTLQVSIDANWWRTHQENDHTFLLAGLGIQLFSEHSHRKPSEKVDKKAGLFDDASRYIVDEELFRHFGQDRETIEPYVPGPSFPQGVYGKNEDGESYSGRVQTEPFFEYLKSLIPEQEQPQSGGNGEGDKGKKNKQKGQSADGEGNGEGDGDEPSDEVDEKGLQKLIQETMEENPADANELVESAVGEEAEQGQNDGGKPGGKQAGTGKSTLYRTYEKMKIIPKKRWEEILFAWARKVKERDLVISWRENPRHLNPILQHFDARLPASVEDETWVKKRERVIAFADTSGSCVSYFDRFAKAVMSLPEEKFDLTCYCFDTQIYKVDRQHMKLKGGGGTDLNPCVNEVNRLMQEENYSPTVFCITDGYFSLPRNIKNPEKWFFFLTEGSTRDYLPKESKVFELKEFE